jgi:hypothetical protein
MELKRSSLRILLAFLLLLVSACATSTPDNPVSQMPEIAGNPSPTQTKTPTIVASAVSATPSAFTLLPSATSESIPTKIPSPTHTPSPSCPIPSMGAPFALPSTTTELQASILTFVNGGGQWEDMWALLDEMEIRNDAIQADINGNGVMETAVYAVFYVEDYIPDHAWWIFQCTTNQYELIYDVKGNWAFHSHFIADDLNNDKRSEIIQVGGFAGSACTLEPRVWSWQIDRIVDLSPDHLELELGCAIDQRVTLQDISGDGVKEMILTGKTVGHLDYAPTRGITQTFTLQDTGYKLESTVFAPTDLRIHVLDDAQRALDAGDLALAALHYTRAAYEEMMTIESYYLYARHVDDADIYQRGFALFRLLVIKLGTGNEEVAHSILTELNALYLENMAGHEFVVLAQTFFDAFRENRSLGESCARVTEYASEYYYGDTQTEPPPLISHFYWGANIASYTTPDSFCPIFADFQSRGIVKKAGSWSATAVRRFVQQRVQPTPPLRPFWA